MENQNYDVVVIGSGPGGYIAAIRAAQLGLKTACVEKDSLGGTCLNIGCIPSKALLQSSEHYDWLKKESHHHGISCSDPKVDFSKILKRKEEVVEGLVKGVGGLFKLNGVTSIHGSARFRSAQTIEVNGQQISAKYFILATGSEPIELPFLKFNEQTIVSSTGALSLPKIPKRLLVIGAGVIGVELASVYNRLGSAVTIVEMLEQICPSMDEALSKSLLQELKKQGMTFHLGTKVVSAEKKSKSMELTIEKNNQSEKLEADVVLVAIGRRPYTKNLGLENLNLEMHKGFVTVDANFRTSVPNIFAIGDLIEGPMLAHKASEEGFAVAEIIANKTPHMNYMAIPNVIYTHPEVASLGFTEKEAREKSLEIVVGNASFKANGRARCAGYAEGFVKVIGLRNSKLLIGMHMIGPQVSELINMGVIAIEKRATLLDLALAPIAHPTLSETVKEAALQALLKDKV